LNTPSQVEWEGSFRHGHSSVGNSRGACHSSHCDIYICTQKTVC